MEKEIKNVWDGVYADGGYGDLVPDQELVESHHLDSGRRRTIFLSNRSMQPIAARF